MDVILKDDVHGLGQKDDIVTVKDGYARNYLIPRGMAITATVPARKIHAELLRQRTHKEEKIRQEALDLSDRMKDISLTIGAKTSTKGKIFGSVNTIQISEALKKEGFEIDRKNIAIKGDLIKEVGTYTATVKLHKEVEVEIPFIIEAE